MRENHASAAIKRINSGIWPALLIALVLHALMLLLPLSGQSSKSNPALAQIELQLIRPEAKPVAKDIFLIEPEPPPSPTTLPPVQTQPQVVVPTPTVATLVPIERDPEHMSQMERSRLTNTILSSQFITKESAADQLFGRRVAHYNIETQADFHYPERDNLTTILSKPMQELPFEYTPGLVYFAYDPGVRGSLQRFWDVITPEFGWITKHGTEVKCKLILIIAGCAWK